MIEAYVIVQEATMHLTPATFDGKFQSPVITMEPVYCITTLADQGGQHG